ncbi:hypothetical protein [Actinomadura sp. DC4]|uniref:hypothetical protein n=1 Tax=Actinomadura sp. DC4 TaxID=3055069 RepID=UPI0025B03F10|nr:hypothetical protein [Actinomadura sp. DC4]MDN3350985.1 hypothetical protein [Actinomadura sp. DC4]
MIILSGVLVVVAIALLVTGIVTGNTGHEVAGLDGLKLIYVSIGVSIISALCLAIGVFLRRKELFGSAESASTKRSAASRSGKAARPAKAKARVGAGDDAPTVPATSATALDVPAETSVFVVPGRKRYHLETCRQLAGRDKEELTFVEAREEGFTACTACLPDTALAVRAAFTENDSEESDDARSTESLDTADLGGRGDDPAQVTRTDLPVTRLDDDDIPSTTTSSSSDSGTAEIEPAAASPAAAELRDEPETSTRPEREGAAETTQFDQVGDIPEAAPEPAAERPSAARKRSFFEPLERPDGSEQDSADDEPAEDTSPPETTDEGPAEETASHEDALVEPEAPEPPEDDAEAEEPVVEEPVVEEAQAEEPLAGSTDDLVADEPEPEPAVEEPEPAPEPEAAEETPPAEEQDEPAAHSDLPFVRILSGTKRYHRPDCALIEDIADDADDLETLSPAAAKERGCTPCLVCQPDKDPSDDSF